MVPITATCTVSSCRTLGPLTCHRYPRFLVLQAPRILLRGFLPSRADCNSPGGFGDLEPPLYSFLWVYTILGDPYPLPRALCSTRRHVSRRIFRAVWCSVPFVGYHACQGDVYPSLGFYFKYDFQNAPHSCQRCKGRH